MKRIVIAYDGSDGGREALVTGVELARGAGAVATLVYVRRAPAPLVGDPFYERALSKGLRRGRDVLDEARAYAAEAGVVVETELLEGDEAERILELARRRSADLVVVGSRDRGADRGGAPRERLAGDRGRRRPAGARGEAASPAQAPSGLSAH